MCSNTIVDGTYEQLLDKLEGLVWQAEPATLRVTYTNRRAAEVFRVSREDSSAQRVTLIRWLHPDDAVRVLALLRAAAADGASRSCVHRLITADGGILQLRTQIHALERDGQRVLLGISDELEQAPTAERAGSCDARVRMVTEQLPATVWTTDRDLRITSALGAGLALLGLVPEELVGVTLEDYFAESENRHAAIEAHRRALMGETVDYEAEWGGKVFRARVEPLRDEATGAVGAINVALDVTDMRRAQNALAQSAERMRTLIEALPDPVLLQDGGGRWLEVNAACLRLFGLEGTNWRGRDVDEDSLETRIGREALEHCKATTEEVWRRGALSRSEEVISQHDGTTRTFDVYKVPLFYPDGRRKGLVTLGRDITERKRAEEERARRLAYEESTRAEAQEAERRARFLAEASRLLAGSLDCNTALSQTARLMVPYVADWCMVVVKDEEGLPRVVATAHADPERDAPLAALRGIICDTAAPKGLGAALRTGEAVVHGRLMDATSEIARLGIPPDARDLVERLGVASYMALPLIARGRICGAIAFFSASESRLYGPADIALAEDLAGRVALAVEHSMLLERTERAVRMRDDFLSVAAHELRTPLTTLQIELQALQRAVGQGRITLPEAQSTKLARAQRQVITLVRLVEALLDVSRISAGRLELQPEETDLAEVVREVVSRFSEQLTIAGCMLELRVMPASGRWDRLRLEQVVTNLLTNAMKFGRGRPIEISVEAETHAARLRVRDHGIGIDPAALGRIFDRFERAVSTRSYGGLGLGLYITRQIVAAHGGTIEVQSQPGQGATFTVTLPRTSQERFSG